jgi:hypothetical protein
MNVHYGFVVGYPLFGGSDHLGDGNWLVEHFLCVEERC